MNVLCFSKLPLLASQLINFDQLFQRAHVFRLRSIKALVITLRNKLVQRNLPWFLGFVGEGSELLWIHSQFTRHLDMSMAQVESPPCFEPRLQFRGDAFHIVKVVFVKGITDVAVQDSTYLGLSMPPFNPAIRPSTSQTDAVSCCDKPSAIAVV